MHTRRVRTLVPDIGLAEASITAAPLYMLVDRLVDQEKSTRESRNVRAGTKKRSNLSDRTREKHKKALHHCSRYSWTCLTPCGSGSMEQTTELDYQECPQGKMEAASREEALKRTPVRNNHPEGVADIQKRIRGRGVRLQKTRTGERGIQTVIGRSGIVKN